MKKVFGLLAVLLAASMFISFLSDSYEKYKENKEMGWIKEWEEKQPYFTKDHLSYLDMRVLDVAFDFECTPKHYSEAMREDEGSDYSYIEITPTAYTEKAIAVLNYYLFDYSIYNWTLDDLEKKYGLTYNHRITMEWLLENPHDMADLYLTYPDGMHFEYRETVLKTYEALNTNTTYMPQNLSYVELGSMYGIFAVETSPEFYSLREPDNLEGEDYSDLVLHASPDTEKILDYVNDLLFSKKARKDKKATDKAKELGFSKDNPITPEWLCEHPREMLEIKDAMDNHGNALYGELLVRLAEEDAER